MDFYKTRAWRQLRCRVLRRSGGKCECCGRGKGDGVVLHVDHICPRSKFPALALEETNLQVLCAECNLGKSNENSIDWRRLDTRPRCLVCDARLRIPRKHLVNSRRHKYFEAQLCYQHYYEKEK